MFDIFGLFFVLAFLTAVVFFLIAWLVYLIINNAAIVDVFWSISLLAIASIYVYIGDSSVLYRVVFYVMVFVWAVRLGGHLLLTRVFLGKKDSRYEAMANKCKGGLAGSRSRARAIKLKFLWTYLFQAFLATCVSVALVGLALPYGSFTVWMWLGIVLFGLGLTGETLADWQLQKFKGEEAKRGVVGGVCNVGLWSWSRHPNLFFEWLCWCGFASMSTGTTYGAFAWLGPIVLFVVLLTLSIPIGEKELLKTRRNIFQEYQATTNMFIPFPVKFF